MRESASAQGHNPDSFDMLLYEYPYLGSTAPTSQCPALFYGLGNLRKSCSNAGVCAASWAVWHRLLSALLTGAMHPACPTPTACAPAPPPSLRRWQRAVLQ